MNSRKPPDDWEKGERQKRGWARPAHRMRISVGEKRKNLQYRSLCRDQNRGGNWLQGGGGGLVRSRTDGHQGQKKSIPSIPTGRGVFATCRKGGATYNGQRQREKGRTTLRQGGDYGTQGAPEKWLEISREEGRLFLKT